MLLLILFIIIYGMKQIDALYVKRSYTKQEIVNVGIMIGKKTNESLYDVIR